MRPLRGLMSAIEQFVTRSDRLVALLFGAIFLMSPLIASAQQASNATNDKHRGTSAAPAASASRTPADMPPKPPRVTCSGGQLTIFAENSTLTAVLNAIRDCTGAEIVVPEDTAGQRLFAEVGPGPVRAVVADLLSSTDFNYVISASPSDPRTIQTLLLSPRPNESPTEIVATIGNVPPNWRAWLEAQQNPAQSAAAPQDEYAHESNPALTAPVETATAPAAPDPVETVPPNPASAAYAALGPALIQAAEDFPGTRTPQNQGKNTEQLIDDMRRMYDQRKQMAQLQTPTAE